MATTASTSARNSRVTGWDYAAIGLLAIAGFALSYDALRQTGVAIHVRGPLTYVFPLIIDGFIAYSVRALLLLRTAPLAARAYVWLLFGASTTASIWANVLHAVRLNQQTLAVTDHLHLSDLSVGILSAAAPLALAGSVHLGIITGRHPGIARHAAGAPTAESAGTADLRAPGADRSGAHADGPWSGQDGPDRHGTADGPADGPGADRDERPTGMDSGGSTGRSAGRPAAATIEELTEIGRQAWHEVGKLTRDVVEDAIRARGLTVANERLTVIVNQLRDERDAADQGACQLAVT